MATVKVFPLNPSGAATLAQFPYSGQVVAGSDGAFTIDVRDLPEAQRGGFSVAFNAVMQALFASGNAGGTALGPLAANADKLFSSAAASNGSMAIANQPDYPRQIQWVFFPGTSLTSAGTLTLYYNANDGTVLQTDSFALVTAASTNISGQATKGVARMTSMAITGLVGGNSPTIRIGTTAALAVPVLAGTQDIAILGEALDAAGVAVANAGTLTNAGIYTPNTAPTASHTYQVNYSLAVAS